MVKLTVVVPVYNVEKYIHKCVDSILNQTYTQFKLILVNDGSSDNSAIICDEYSKKDTRVTVIHKSNGGLADARNIGIKFCDTELIAFVDSDDFIELDMYEKMTEAMDDNDIDIVTCGRYDIYNNIKIPKFGYEEIKTWSPEKAIQSLLLGDGIDSSACDKVFKKSLFNEISFPNGKDSEDMFIMVKLIQKSNKVMHIGKCMYYYNHRVGIITYSKFSERHMDALDASKLIEKEIIDNFPSLKLEAKFFKVNTVLYLIGFLVSSDSKNEHIISYRKLKKEISKNFFYIIMSSRFTFRIKLYSFLWSTNIYYLARNIKKLFKIIE